MKVINQKLLFAIVSVALFSAFSMRWIGAQSPDGDWSSAERLSSEEALASQGYMVRDQYGYVHVLWVESGFPDGRPQIAYSRFNGETWSPPSDIHVGWYGVTIVFLSPFIDQYGTLHLIWSESNSGPVYYASAPANNAASAKNWSKPVLIDIPAFWGRLLVDSKGIMHVIFSDFYGETPGIYYIRSMDQGQTWSSPIWLDADIPEGYAPTTIEFGLDDQDGLHAEWYYVDPNTAQGVWIRYARSTDGGNTWSQPFTIDRADEANDELRLPYPEFLVDGQTVHIVWAGDSQVHREDRVSYNAGQSWGPTNRILGDLQGQALGGGLAVDGKGRTHYVTQVRYPTGLWHAIWDRGSWDIPTMFYLIAGDSGEFVGVHAHNVRLAIRAGNQLVVTFTSAPTDPQMILYAMHMTLNDTPPIPALPTPTPAPTDLPEPTATPELQTSTPDATIVALANAAPAPASSFNPAAGILWGLIPLSFLLMGLLIFRSVRKR